MHRQQNIAERYERFFVDLVYSAQVQKRVRLQFDRKNEVAIWFFAIFQFRVQVLLVKSFNYFGFSRLGGPCYQVHQQWPSSSSANQIFYESVT